MFARLFMFAFVVFFALPAFSSTDPEFPGDRINRINFTHDRRVDGVQPDWNHV